MKIGYQTIILGERIADLDAALDAIAAAGYTGIELAQRPDMLGERGRQTSFSDLVDALERRKLKLVGLANGTLEERMAFCGTQTGPHYLYIDKWDSAAALAAVARGFTLALHLHAFMRLSRLAAVADLLKSYPELRWLPDTGHLHVIGEDVLSALRLAPAQIAAVHLKDWTPAYGRSTHRYSRGFTGLGAGVVPLERILTQLATMDYDGWLIVEQDYTQTDPFAAIFNSAMWLYDKGVLPTKPRRVPAPRPISIGAARKASESEASAIVHLAGASIQNTERAYQTIAEAFDALIPCRLITVWTPSLEHGVLSLQMVYPEMPIGVTTLEPEQSLSGMALERHAITEFDVSSEAPGAKYGRPDVQMAAPELITRLGLTQLISVPIFDTCNKNHVRTIVNLFPKEAHAPVPCDSLSTVAEAVSRLADLVLDRKCLDATAAATLAAKAKSPYAFAHETCWLLRNTLHCEGVTLFVVNGPGDRLEPWGTTGIRWLINPSEPFYRLGEGITGKVWATKKTRMSANALAEPDRTGRSSEIISSPPHSCLWVPVLNAAGDLVGMFRCQNKHIGAVPGPVTFSDDDVAVAEALGQAMLSHLTVLIAESHRQGAVDRLTHELQRPANAIRNAVELMRDELNRNGVRPDTAFTYDYLGDVARWSELMIGLIDNADFYGERGDRLILDPAPTRIMGDVIAPAVRQIEMLLRMRKFPAHKIEYGRFEEVPSLFVDRGKLQQVMFNLLANAIKYAFKDPSAFRITIDGHRVAGEYRIDVRDWGEGIPAGFEEKIFEEGFRAPRAGGRAVTGQGFGLYIVRLIVKAHGGRVQVSKRHMPTVISLYLPDVLAHRGL